MSQTFTGLRIRLLLSALTLLWSVTNRTQSNRDSSIEQPCPLSLCHIEEMMAERGVLADHATVHRWSLKILPVLATAFRRRQRPVGKSWGMDETYIKVRGCWKYFYRAVDRDGATVDFLLTAHRDEAAARRYLERAIDRHGEPEKITIDKSGANTAANQ
jgi:putative transposase